LLDPVSKSWLTIDGPDSLATAEFIVPPVAPDKAWTMEGPLLRGDRSVGEIIFTHQTSCVRSNATRLWSPAGGLMQLIALVTVFLFILAWTRWSTRELPSWGTGEAASPKQQSDHFANEVLS